MATKIVLKTTFEAEKVIQPIFTGGSVSLDHGAKILATTLGEDVVLTDLTTGKNLAKIEGDGEAVSTLTRKKYLSRHRVDLYSNQMPVYSNPLRVSPHRRLAVLVPADLCLEVF